MISSVALKPKVKKFSPQILDHFCRNIFLKNGPFQVSHFLYLQRFHAVNKYKCFLKKLPIAGFKPGSSGIWSGHFASGRF